MDAISRLFKPKRESIFSLLIISIFAFLHFQFIRTSMVNVFILDDWDYFLAIKDRMGGSGFYFEKVFFPFAEFITTVPAWCIYFLGEVFQYDTRVFLLMSYILNVMGLLLILGNRPIDRIASSQFKDFLCRLVTLLLVSALWFTPATYGSSMRACELITYVMLFFTLLSIKLFVELNLPGSHFRSQYKLVFLIFCAVAASMSGVQGYFALLLGLYLAIGRFGSVRLTALIVSVFGVLIWATLRLRFVHAQGDPMYAVLHPGKMIMFFLNYLGSGIYRPIYSIEYFGIELALLGLVLFLIYLLILFDGWRTRKLENYHLLILFTLFVALATTIGRSSFPIWVSGSAHYMPCKIVGLVGAVCWAMGKLGNYSGISYLRQGGAVFVLLLASTHLYTFYGVRNRIMLTERERRFSILDGLFDYEKLSDQKFRNFIHPNRTVFEGNASRMARLGMGVFSNRFHLPKDYRSKGEKSLSEMQDYWKNRVR